MFIEINLQTPCALTSEVVHDVAFPRLVAERLDDCEANDDSPPLVPLSSTEALLDALYYPRSAVLHHYINMAAHHDYVARHTEDVRMELLC